MGSDPQLALTLVLSAACLHALWNAIVKGSSDRVITMGLVSLAHIVPGIVLAVLFLPPLQESWPFLAASTLIHFFYYLFLIASYRYGDLSQVYPIARGIAPVLVALGAQIFAGEVLSRQAWAGILLVSFAISLLLLGKSRKLDGRAIGAALVTGVAIASYSVVDGLGVRVAGSALGYIGWLFMLEAGVATFLLLWRRRELATVSAHSIALGITGGAISALAYAMVIYAKNLAALGAVSAIRESSVIIAALIGVFWFGERPWRIRVVAAMLVALGVFCLATSE